MLRACILFALFSASLSIRPDDKIESHELFNRCLDGQNHKKRPGPEDALHSQCAPWANRSCCTEDTAQLIHMGDLYNFDFDHCRDKAPLSRECKRHFIQDHCFFECSPNVGPWLVKVNKKTRNESFFDVPLCAKDCDRWFDACKNDYTCTDNWTRNFNWTRVGGKKTNVCPTDSSCQTFKEIYQTAENFCQRVWDGSWKYTSDDKPCMKLWFEGKNPNDEVLKWKIDVMTNNNVDSGVNGLVNGPAWFGLLPIALAIIWGY